jgi:ribosome biogenesis GTPase / thiamine phosphate phosphatase
MTGRVIKIFGLYYVVQYGNERVNCVLRGKLRTRPGIDAFSDPVAVGDLVEFDLHGTDSGTIHDVLPRRRVFSRKEKGRNKREDIIASNVDQIVVIQSFRQPGLNLRFVDRLSVRGASGEIPVVLCINKADLADQDTVDYVEEYYANAPIDVVMVSALTGINMEHLHEVFTDRTSLLVGYSGVGKSSILNRLFPGLDLRVAEVSTSTGKGKHTTTNVEMVYCQGDTSIIDTPGLREFGLMDIEPHLAGNYFYEFRELGKSCRFSPCTHDHEPGCEVKRLLDEGYIHEDRYESYLNLLADIRESRERKYQ